MVIERPFMSAPHPQCPASRHPSSDQLPGGGAVFIILDGDAEPVELVADAVGFREILCGAGFAAGGEEGVYTRTQVRAIAPEAAGAKVAGLSKPRKARPAASAS